MLSFQIDLLGLFSKLAPEAYEELWEKNLRYFEEKWGERWEPHRER